MIKLGPYVPVTKKTNKLLYNAIMPGVHEGED